MVSALLFSFAAPVFAAALRIRLRRLIKPASWCAAWTRRKRTASPWQSDVWQQAYPELAGLHFDKAKSRDPMFAPNAANGRLTGNLFVNEQGLIGDIQKNPAKFSDVSGNAVYKMNKLDELFTDPANGDYSLKKDARVFRLLPDFEPLPLSEIGRY